MPGFYRFLIIVLAVSAFPSASVAQRPWVPPQDPCDVKTGHFLVNGGMMHLKIAIEADNEDTWDDRLTKANDVLIDAIVNKNQSDNPGAWYFLGRVYVERRDTFGADSAFARVVAMAPQCTDEVAGYVDQLVPEVRAAALQAWQEGAVDSAVALLRLVTSLSPTSPEAPFYLGRIYSEQQQFDSAGKYVDIGIERAAGDPEHDQRQRQALMDIVRAQESLAFESPAVERLMTSRPRRDSVAQALATDTGLLDKLIAEWSGKNLRPDAQAAVQRDSTALAERVAMAETGLAEAQAAVAGDSSEAAAAFGGAFAAYERYLDVYPEDTETMLRVYRRQSMIGNAAALVDITEHLSRAAEVDLGDAVQAANSAFRDGNAEEAVALLRVADERNPYMQPTLATLARIHYELRDREKLTGVVQRLLEIDPMNPQTVRLMAAAWDLAGEPDSVTKYVELATSGRGIGVTVTQFLPSATSAMVNGTVVNVSDGPTTPAVLVFEFLDTSGTVLATTTAEIPALDPRQRSSFTARTDVEGAAAWRYRRQ
jgi:tetratricopeptide (TPR) repeat protein